MSQKDSLKLKITFHSFIILVEGLLYPFHLHKTDEATDHNQNM